MSLSKVTLFLLATLAVISTLVAKFQNIVHVSNDIEYDDIKKQMEDDLYPGSTLKHTVWFLQISDIHLSLFHDPLRGPDLKRFCTETVSNIKPFVVLATGDLVDSRTLDVLGSKQFVEEWQIYQQILQESAVTNITTWLDIRGNHDNFNVLTSDEENNFFRKYSVQGGKHRRSYKHTLLHDSEAYDFIGIDACMNPGPKRPFNFLGVLQRDEYSHIQSLQEDAKGNMTIWFGHYPTSTIIAPYPGARELMRSSGPYLCGHLHTFGGMVPHMYTLQSTGVLELELADWKDNRKYRLCAIDHGIFSFLDNHLEVWPSILITNPKDATMIMPIEPLYRILKSTHIRVLIFSPEPIQFAKVKINGESWRELNTITPPLFVAAWEPLEYMEGLHTITVYAKDKAGHENTVSHQFSLDGSRPQFPLLARLVLRGHISVGQAIFGNTLLITLLPLCILKICLCFGKGEAIKSKSEFNFVRRWIFKLSLLASIDVVFWPVVIGALYVALGPWFVGYIIDSTIGVCFVWGIFLGGTFLPGGLTYFAGTLYLLTFYIPFIVCLSHCLYHHYRSIINATPGPCNLFFYFTRHCFMLFFIVYQTMWALVYLGSYGSLAFFLGFTHSWSILLALVLWRVVVTLPESKLTAIGRQRPVAGTPLLPNENMKPLSVPVENVSSLS